MNNKLSISYLILIIASLFFGCRGLAKEESKDIASAIVISPGRVANAKHITDTITSGAPRSITRNIVQDKKGNIWIASWEGVIRYDGKSFTNITGKVSSARFFLFWRIAKAICDSALSALVFITMMEKSFKISQPGRGFLIMKSLIFTKIKKVTSGLVFQAEQAVTMEKRSEITS